MDLGEYPSNAEVWNTLISIFPSGTASGFTITMGPWNTIKVDMSSHTGPVTCMWLGPVSDMVLDSCDIKTMDDLVGWASFVRTDIETIAVNTILNWIDPATPKTLTGELGAAWGALWACGIEDVATRLKKEARFFWAYSQETHGGKGIFNFHLDETKYHNLSVSLSGNVQFYPEGHTNDLDYEYLIPVNYPLPGASSISKTDSMKINPAGHATPAMLQLCVAEALTGIYLDALCHYVEETGRIIQMGG